MLWDDDRCLASNCLDPYGIRECVLCPDNPSTYACKTHMPLHLSELHGPPSVPSLPRLRFVDALLRTTKDNPRAAQATSDRRPITRTTRSPPSEAQSADAKRHRPEQKGEVQPPHSRKVEIPDPSRPYPKNREWTPSDRQRELRRPIAFRAGNGPLTVGRAGGRGGRESLKERCPERGRPKQGSLAGPVLASVAKDVCFSHTYVHDVISTGGGVQRDSPPVVRQPYHQDRPRSYAEAAGRLPGGPALIGTAVRIPYHTSPQIDTDGGESLP
jgi:hypothetical protein